MWNPPWAPFGDDRPNERYGGDAPCTSGCAGLLVWIGSRLGLLLGDIATPLRAPRALVSFIEVTPSLDTTLLAVAHRHGHQQHHEHDRDRDNDYDNAGAYREHGDKRDTVRDSVSIFSIIPAGTIPFFPKIQKPVSTMMQPLPMSKETSSMSPM